MELKQYLRVQTQNPLFLWKMVIVISLVGLLVGFCVQFIPRAKSVGALLTAAQEGETGTLIFHGVPGDVQQFEHFLIAVAMLQYIDDEDALSAGQTLAGMELTKEQEWIAGRLLQSLSAEELDPELRETARVEPPTRYANHAIGVFHYTNDNLTQAAEFFEEEGKLPEAEISREYAIDMFRALRDTAALRRLQQDPNYISLFSPSDDLQIAEANRDWGGIFWTIPKLILQRFQGGGATALAVFAGLGWFVIALQMGQVRRANGARFWLCAAAIPLGFLSIWVTHMIDIWQELEWELYPSDELVDGIRYYVVGVGLREEVAKTLMLLPLMPWLVRRRNTLEALIVSACVGLGFAIVENMGYFAASAGTDSMGRFLTANFAHMAMTGMIGLSIARACWSRHELSQSLLVILIVILVHGFYDATIAVPGLKDINFAGFIIFILLSYAFFHEVRQCYSQQSETVSLTATFLFVVSLLTALSFIYLCTQFDFKPSLQILMMEFLSVVLMVYMYLREMPNSLIR